MSIYCREGASSIFEYWDVTAVQRCASSLWRQRENIEKLNTGNVCSERARRCASSAGASAPHRQIERQPWRGGEPTGFFVIFKVLQFATMTPSAVTRAGPNARCSPNPREDFHRWSMSLFFPPPPLRQLRDCGSQDRRYVPSLCWL